MEKESPRTSLLYWFPRIKHLDIPMPETHILLVNRSIIMAAMYEHLPLSLELIDELHATAAKVGYPLFLRTDLQSGKHGWIRTCFVKDDVHLLDNLFGVAEENDLGACSFGPDYEAFVFRKFLELETAFIAFYGQMPINKERRYFIENGEVVCHHPYWPEEAFLEHTDEGGWQEKLAELNYEHDEIEQLTAYAKQVSAALPGYWSVDFARAKDGKWYLIYMALGIESFHWEGCPHAQNG